MKRKKLLKKADATPAEVAGELVKSNLVDNALYGLINFLQPKQEESLNYSFSFFNGDFEDTCIIIFIQ